MTRYTVQPRGPFSLAASAAFLEGFTPAAYGGVPPDHVHLAFVVDGTDDVAGACVTQGTSGVNIDVYGPANPVAVREQTVRILSLDVDGSAFPEVGKRDPVIGRLQERFPGLRPVLFFSPYEAAAWALIGQRIQIVQAAKIKARMAEELGPEVDIHGDRRHAFPSPSRLGQLSSFPGLSTRKVDYLHGLSMAATAGDLDAGRLRSLPPEEALGLLMALPGIGPFSAELILLRGAGVVDCLPRHEQRFPRAVALAYGLPAPPDAAQLAAIAETWRPFRTWLAVLLRTVLEQETNEIGGRRLERRNPV